MSMIPDEVIDQVRDAADMVGIIGESVPLKRTGADYRGPCPFHGGTNRNFSVSPKRGAFYCFVCHEKGDIFSYFMKRFGMDYPTAIREIARRTGIVIPERTERVGPDPNEPLYSTMSVAQDWFARQLVELAEAKSARDYLASRDLPMETVAPLGLGYAPRGREFLAAMAELGVADAALLDTGLLVQRDDGSTHPRFRGRLLFPIHDLRGRPVGFGGRLLGPGEPKYLNSPETKIFHKGGMLYNLHQARNAIRKEEAAVLVEGYFDVLRLSLAGIEHVVAPMGTALTPEQAALIRRYAPQAVLLYDSDAAGLKATFRAGDELLRHGVRVRVATMPTGEDPDTLVRNGGAAALAPIIRDAVDVLERKVQLLERKGWFADVEHRRGALDRLLPTIRAATDPITRDLYLALVAERTGVGRDVLVREVDTVHPGARGAGTAGAPAPQQERRSSPAPARSTRARYGAKAEAQVLQAMLHSAEWWDRALQEVRPDQFEVPRFRDLFATLLEHAVAYPGQQMPEMLSPLQQLLWARLLERADGLGGLPVDGVYADAVQTLEARPVFREIEGIADPTEKQRRKREARERFPQEYMRWYGWLHRRRGGQGQGQGAQG